MENAFLYSLGLPLARILSKIDEIFIAALPPERKEGRKKGRKWKVRLHFLLNGRKFSFGVELSNKINGIRWKSVYIACSGSI